MKETSRDIKALRRLKLCAFALLLCAITSSAPAATYTWTGAGFFGQDYLWSNDFNWAGNAAPSPGEANVTIVFPNNASPKVTTNDIVGLSVASIQFQGSNYVVHGKPSGNALGLFSSGLGGWSVFATGSGNYFAGTCPLSLNNSGAFTVAAGCTLSVLSSVGGAGGFTKYSSGTLKFAAGAANTYAGTTTVYDGTLDLNSGILFPSVTSYVSVPGPLMIGGTNMNYAPRVRLLFDNQIANTAPITVNENALLSLNGHDDVLGPVTVRGGVIDTDVLGGPSSPGTWTLNNNVTNLLSSTGAEGRISGRLYLGAFARTFHTETNSELKIEASISDSPAFDPGFAKTGPGRLVLSNATSTYSGPTVVQEGKLRLQGSNTLLGATSGATVVSTNGGLELDNAQIGLEPLTLNGGPQKAPLQFMSTEWNSWAGPVTLNGNCTLVGWQESIFSHGLDISGPISGPGLLCKAGDGTLKLSGAVSNTFTGGLFVEKGWVMMEKLGNVPALSGPLVIGGDYANHPAESFISIGDWHQIPDNLPVTIRHTGQLYVQSGVVEVLGHLTMAGGFVKNWGGFLTLSGNITNHSVLTDNGYEDSYIDGNVYLSPGTHVFDSDHSFAKLVLGGVVAGDGAITKTGPATLELRATNTYSGLTWVQEGTLMLLEGACPGSDAAGTVLEPEAQLYLSETSVTNESLTIKGTYVASPYSVSVNGAFGTNRWRGPITLQGQARFRTAQHLILDGPITGPGGFTYVNTPGSGPGKIQFTGANANTFAGSTTVEGGALLLNKSGAIAIPGDLNITGTTNLWYGTNIWSAVRLLQPNQIANDSSVTVASVHKLELDGNVETIGLLTGDGKVDLGNATLTTGAKGSSTFSGLITGSGGLTKVGSRSFTLMADNTYTGQTTISEGVLMVFGQQPGSTVTVTDDARLGGTGRVGGVACFNGGEVSPGDGPGVLNGGVFNSVGSSATLRIEINGASPGGYDQFKANGTVSLMGGVLQLLMNVPGAVGQQYIIVDNDGVDPVGGTFTGMPEGSMVTNNGVVFQISYAGGTGNDVVLTQMVAGAAPQFSDVEKLGNGTIQLSGTGFPNTTYAVEATQNLNPPVQWTNIGSIDANGLGQIIFTDSQATNFPMRFYRFKLQ